MMEDTAEYDELWFSERAGRRRAATASSDDDDWGFVRRDDEPGSSQIPARIQNRTPSPARPLGSRRRPGLQGPQSIRADASSSRGSSARQRPATGFDAIREYAVHRAEETSVRRLSAEIGPPMRPSALQVFLQGAEPYTRNAAVLRAWYERVGGAEAAAERGKEADAAWRNVPRRDLFEFVSEQVVRTSLRGVARGSGASTTAIRNFIERGPDAFSSPKVVRKLAEYYVARGGALAEDQPVTAPPEFRFLASPLHV